MCQFSASEGTPYFTSAAVVYRVRGKDLFKGFKEMEITGSKSGSLAFDLLPRNGWEVMEQSP